MPGKEKGLRAELLTFSQTSGHLLHRHSAAPAVFSPVQQTCTGQDPRVQGEETILPTLGTHHSTQSILP